MCLLHTICPHTLTPYKLFNVDNSCCDFLHHVGDEVELVARAAGMEQEKTYTDMTNTLAEIRLMGVRWMDII